MSFVDFSNVKVLLVEDNNFVRVATRKSLSDVGVKHISEAAHGREALEQLERHIPDIIICDISMQEMDGFAVLDAVRAHEEWRDLPFIFLTGHAEEDSVKRAIDLKVNGYLLKPVQTEDLRSKLTTLLRRAA